MPMTDIVCAARGDCPADLLLANARIVNVFSSEVIAGDIAIYGDRIVGLGDYNARRRIDVEGRFVAPGFIDAHVHIESAMVSVGQFVRAVLPCGTTTVAADPHEIANVLGTEGIEFMLGSARNQPMQIYFTLPSCVPATHMETAGARLGAEDLAPFLACEEVIGLAEMMNYPGVVAADPQVLAKLDLARRQVRVLDGHAPGLSGPALNAYVAAGIGSDHECTTVPEAREKLAAGMHIMIREGTCARNLQDLLPLVTPKTARRVMWCTDDRHPHDLLNEGHIDHMLRLAIAAGLDPITAIQMATLNPSEYFGLDHVGAIAPGRRADLVIFSDLFAPRAEQVYSGGVLVAEKGRMLPHIVPPAPLPVPTAMRIDTSSVDLAIPAAGERIRVIDIIADQVVTGNSVAQAHIDRGLALADTERDLLKIAVVERYSGHNRTGLGFVRGFGLDRGALASSVAHDSHNIIVVGADDRSMHRALKSVVEMNGGLAVAHGDDVLARLSLPIGGLMSPDPLDLVRNRVEVLIDAAHRLGAAAADPFMALGFVALPVIPALKITDKGLVDVARFEIVPLFV